MFLSDFAVKHPAIVTILVASLVIFAFIAFNSLNSEMIPPVGLPQANIVTIFPGASAETVEKEVSRIIENEMSTLAGISSLISTSSDSFSIVTLEFQDKVNASEKLPQIRELLYNIEDKLPDGIQGNPTIHIIEASAFLPILSVRIESSIEAEELTSFIEDHISPSIARVPGVSRISLVGSSKTEAHVELNIAELEARGISALNVFEVLQYNNLSIPAGTAEYRNKNLSFTSSGSFASLDELKNLTVGAGDGSYIYLKDIADISLKKAPKKIEVRSNKKEFLMLDVLKRDEGDTIKIVKSTTEILEKMKKESNGIIDYAIISNQSETTERSLQTVMQSALTGFILTILVILFLLHDIRATIIISISIPLSILFAILGLWGTGRSLNLLSLSGMTVAIGMIVDNSIVVLENTYKHFSVNGDKKKAALSGAGELGGAVLASTSTSVSVFAPLLFLTGIIGVIMNDLSLAIVFALGSSALVAVVVVPWLSSLLLKKNDEQNKKRWMLKIENSIDSFMGKTENSYHKSLKWVLSNKLFSLISAIMLFFASIILVSILRMNFLPPTDTGEFEIHIETPPGYTLEQTKNKVDAIDALVANLVPEIDAAVYYVGTDSALSLTDSPNKAFGRIRLVPNEKRKRIIQDIIPIIQNTLSENIPDANITVLNGGFDSLLALGTGGQGYQLEIYGSDLDKVNALAITARNFLNQDPDVFKTEISLRSDVEQVIAKLSQSYMGALGVTPYEAGITSRILFGGMDVGTLHIGDKDYSIRLDSNINAESLTDDTLNKMALRTHDGRYVSFAAFSKLESKPTLTRIDRKDRNFSVEITGFLRVDDHSGVVKRMNDAMQALDIPSEVHYAVSGVSALMQDSISSLVMMFAISIFLVYAVMVIQFERFIQPLIIMASIPFCLIGVVLGLYLFGSSISIIAMLAVITLGGIVVNNAIVMVDYINLLRREKKLPLQEAIFKGSLSRLRPILMTTMTTLVGILPMALAHGNGSEVYAPLGQAIFGGLLSSTLITLYIIPALYEAIEKRRLKRLGIQDHRDCNTNCNTEDIADCNTQHNTHKDTHNNTENNTKEEDNETN